MLNYSIRKFIKAHFKLSPKVLISSASTQKRIVGEHMAYPEASEA